MHAGWQAANAVTGQLGEEQQRNCMGLVGADRSQPAAGATGRPWISHRALPGGLRGPPPRAQRCHLPVRSHSGHAPASQASCHPFFTNVFRYMQSWIECPWRAWRLRQLRHSIPRLRKMHMKASHPLAWGAMLPGSRITVVRNTRQHSSQKSTSLRTVGEAGLEDACFIACVLQHAMQAC